MTQHNNILIRNIYYMLSYAFQALRERNYEHIDKEDFEYIEDMFAEILVRAVSQQLKQGLYRQYTTYIEDLSTLKGKLDIPGTIRNKINCQPRLTCEIDNLSADNIYNQIVKTTLHLLLKSPEVKDKRKVAIRRQIPYFANIQTVEARSIRWNALTIHRNNYAYHWLMYICYFVINKFILSTEQGDVRVLAYTEDLLHKLYEKFVLSYFQKHHPDLRPTSEQIAWAITGEQSSFLPRMQSDIMLHNGNDVFIIDTKFYGSIMQRQFDKATFRNNNLYQIFTYVVNKAYQTNGCVKGMLLYAETVGEKFDNVQQMISGHEIMIRTLDLNCEFKCIKSELDNIANIIRY